MAEVIHKSTTEYRPSAHTPDYDPADWVINPTWVPDRVSVLSKAPYIKVDAGNVVREMTVAEKSLYRNDPARLLELKRQRHDEINKRTTELIEQNGFVYSTLQFSLSMKAQNKWSFFDIGMDNGVINTASYPVRVATKDDLSKFDIADKATAKDMVKVIIETGLGIIGSGQSFKDAINAATTAEEVDLVVDTR